VLVRTNTIAGEPPSTTCNAKGDNIPQLPGMLVDGYMMHWPSVLLWFK
jgi:hypothetical protein